MWARCRARLGTLASLNVKLDLAHSVILGDLLWLEIALTLLFLILDLLGGLILPVLGLIKEIVDVELSII